ncbi:hypothetical protein [Rubellicoccus peritrichatus]|uniref:Uncharacterized protein n=1 Tax=Rubellicoccus peritrichatus TaxID=3080537 RepID=A0AAQ3L641_9BACT|nr:hypothetical protein [Puniceicoccus sp. CR14]WOO40169.1 hypothetical protein RZN69_16225 [Puniceicoccus sp. CR14]
MIFKYKLLFYMRLVLPILLIACHDGQSRVDQLEHENELLSAFFNSETTEAADLSLTELQNFYASTDFYSQRGYAFYTYCVLFRRSFVAFVKGEDGESIDLFYKGVALIDYDENVELSEQGIREIIESQFQIMPLNNVGWISINDLPQVKSDFTELMLSHVGRQNSMQGFAEPPSQAR